MVEEMKRKRNGRRIKNKIRWKEKGNLEFFAKNKELYRRKQKRKFG
jgi:hypothetical protein